MAFEPHINNLYAPEAQDILLFKEIFEMEKLDGTGAKLLFKYNNDEVIIQYHSGGASYELFVKLFNSENLINTFKSLQLPKEYVLELYGEAAGGKIQKMSDTYGPNLFFIGYDVKINEKWLNVTDAEDIFNKFGLEFVPYSKITTDMESIDKAKLAFSRVAVRKGMGDNKQQEGIILRPVIEVIKNSGQRIIAKHKNDAWRETNSPKKVVDPSKIELIKNINVIADEYVVIERLKHVLDRIPEHCIEKMGEIIKTMVEDVLREGEFEIDATIKDSKELRQAISKNTAFLYKQYMKSQLK